MKEKIKEGIKSRLLEKTAWKNEIRKQYGIISIMEMADGKIIYKTKEKTYIISYDYDTDNIVIVGERKNVNIT